jgi:glycine/D-amino acid oxidase-like deaminating enzyme
LRAFPVLSGEVQADVAIIGAGYTGLSAAHHIAKSGLVPLVLEANQPGWGASGRNGGVITAKFRFSFRGIDAAHGRAMAKRMYEIAHESLEIVEELVSEFGIASARLTRSGQVRAAHNHATLQAAVDEADWMKREMGGADVRTLDAHQVREKPARRRSSRRAQSRFRRHPSAELSAWPAGRCCGAGRPNLSGKARAAAARAETARIVIKTPSGAVRARQAIIATQQLFRPLTEATRHMQRTLVPFRASSRRTSCRPDIAGRLMPTGRTCYRNQAHDALVPDGGWSRRLRWPWRLR